MSIEVVRYQGKPIYRAYGQLWPSVPIMKDDGAARLAIELEAFRVGLSPEQGGKGSYGHFKTICEWLWPKFTWNRWAIRLAKAFCAEKYVGVTGCASSGKSAVLTLYGMVRYLADPENTLVLVLTTSVKDAETRIWADFTNRFNEMLEGGITMFKMVGREHYIGFKDTSKGKGRGSSISLVAAADEFRDDAVKKLQGAKNENVILLWDEAQDCSIDVFRAALNLRNNPNFEFKCAGNAAMPFDAHGTFNTPINGWNSITAEDKEWPIEVNGKLGVCIHLDGLDTPNNDRYEELGNKNAYVYLKRVEEVEADIKGLGEKDPAFWRQCRGFWPPQGVDIDVIFPQADFQKFEALDRNISWVQPPVQVLCVDPSYTSGGDRFIVTHLKFGNTQRPLPTIFREKTYDLKIEGSTQDSSLSLNMVNKVRRLAEELKIPPFNIGVDGGSGDLIVHAFHDHWSREIMAVHFGGSPSDRIYCTRDPRPCKDVFDRKASELWYIMREFLTHGQIAGLDNQICREMSVRKYEMRNRKIKIEGKASMKERTNGISPDEGDSLAIGFDLLRERFKLVAGQAAKQTSQWAQLFGGPIKNRVDRPATYKFKSLQTMQRSNSKEATSGSLDSLNRMLGRNP